MPTQFLGPPPNGKKASGWRFDFLFRENLKNANYLKKYIFKDILLFFFFQIVQINLSDVQIPLGNKFFWILWSPKFFIKQNLPKRNETTMKTTKNIQIFYVL